MKKQTFVSIIVFLVLFVPVFVLAQDGSGADGKVSVLATVLAFIVGTILPIVFGTILPNSLFHSWGVKAGRKLSSAGRKAVKKQAWESFENKLTGSFFAFAQGFQEGADEDDQI